MNKTALISPAVSPTIALVLTRFGTVGRMPEPTVGSGASVSESAGFVTFRLRRACSFALFS